MSILDDSAISIDGDPEQDIQLSIAAESAWMNEIGVFEEGKSEIFNIIENTINAAQNQDIEALNNLAKMRCQAFSKIIEPLISAVTTMVAFNSQAKAGGTKNDAKKYINKICEDAKKHVSDHIAEAEEHKNALRHGLEKEYAALCTICDEYLATAKAGDHEKMKRLFSEKLEMDNLVKHTRLTRTPHLVHYTRLSVEETWRSQIETPFKAETAVSYEVAEQNIERLKDFYFVESGLAWLRKITPNYKPENHAPGLDAGPS